MRRFTIGNESQRRQFVKCFFFLLNGEGNNFQVRGPGSFFFVTSSFVITPFLKNDFFFSFNESNLNLREICGRVKCQRLSLIAPKMRNI